jgi:hypothetical protein
VPLKVERKEPLRLLLNLTRSYDFGIWQASLDGVDLGAPLDLYDSRIESREYHLLDFWPEPGEHLLKLTCVGRNPASAGYYLGIESARLRERRPRVAAWGFDRDLDWRKSPKLYE